MTGTIKAYTPNFNFIIPEFNITGWHDYIEEDLRSIDALLYNIFDIQKYAGRWQRLTAYESGQVVFIDDSTDPTFMGKMYKVLINHTTADLPFDEFYETNPTYYERFLDASSAQQFARYCKIYAEGTDEEAAELGITHSCKNWEILCNNLVTSLLDKHYGKKLTYTNNIHLNLLDENDNIISTVDVGGTLPNQSGQNGKLLTTNGNTASWLEIASSVDSSSTNYQPVGAKLFYDTLGNLESILYNINSGE